MRKLLLVTFILMLLCSAGKGQSAEQKIRYRLITAKQPWSLDFTLPPNESVSEESKPERHWFLAFPLRPKKPTGIFQVQVTMVPAQGATDAVKVRDQLKKELDLSDLKLLERNGIPMLTGRPREFFPGIAGSSAPPPKYILSAYWLKDQTAIELEVTFIGKRNDVDDNAFFELVDSMKFVAKSQPISSFDYYQLGRARYLKQEYKPASDNFLEALVLERKERQLSIPEFRDLVVQAADSFGALKEIDNFRAVFDFGVAIDPSYPLFHWGLARYYAAKGDKGKTLECLGRMYENIAKEDRKPKDILFTLNTVRTVPEENSFMKAFMKDPAFKQAIKQMRER